MTLRYVRNGDGYIVHSRERAICVVHTKTSEYLPVRQAPDGTVRPAEVVDRHLPQNEWQFHFYHGFYTPAILKELVDLLPKAEPDNGRGPAPQPPADARGPVLTPVSKPLQDEPFALSPEDEAKRRSILEHHERAVRAKPQDKLPATEPAAVTT